MLGCGPRRPATAPVSGKVTLGGRPVSTGRIMFCPAEGRPALAAIGSDGSYALTTFEHGDGAILGKHRVTIQASQVTGGLSLPKSLQEEMRGVRRPTAPLKVEWIVPEPYSRVESTPLSAEVLPNANKIDFDVKPSG